MSERPGRGTGTQRERTALRYLVVVTMLAESLRGRGLSRAELIQEGSIGLLRAIDRHDGTEGRSLESFVGQQVRLFMLRAIRRRQIARRRQRTWSPAHELAASCLVPDPFSIVSNAELEAEVDRVLRALSVLDRSLLELRFGLDGQRGRTVDATARALGLRPHRVERLELLAIARVRQKARRLLPLFKGA